MICDPLETMETTTTQAAIKAQILHMLKGRMIEPRHTLYIGTNIVIPCGTLVELLDIDFEKRTLKIYAEGYGTGWFRWNKFECEWGPALIESLGLTP